jgi:hypothetical protein
MDNIIWKSELTEQSVKHLSDEQLRELKDKLHYANAKLKVEYGVGVERHD